jgi:hypothetical protein
MILQIVLSATAVEYPVVTPGSNIIAFTGAPGEDVFKDIVQLSDKTLLVAGHCRDLAWLPASVAIIELPVEGIDSRAGSGYGFLMQLSSDAGQIRAFVHFPEGTVQDVSRIRTTNQPGATTGDMVISGIRVNSARTNNKGQTLNGYYLARLNDNFVSGVPDACEWTHNVDCPSRRAGGNMDGLSDYGEIQPWDVGTDGSVIFGRGAEFDYDWAIIEKLDAAGQLTTVRYWRTHWTDTPAEIAGTLDTYDNSKGVPVASGIVMKVGRGSLRSWTQKDYDYWQNDANGGRKKGKWPNDYYFSGPKGNSTKGGYTGYKTSGKPTARVGGIVIDRRDNHLYFGYNNQSVLPGGNPDYEPAVVAMDAEGRLKWWSRLYPEFLDKDGDGVVSDGDVTTSSPDQYVDGLAIDYTAADGGALVVVARCHGNNTINFWNGNDIQYPANPGSAFQNRFTGTNGNIHLSWIGRFSLQAEQIRHATYLAEMNEGAKTQGSLTDALVADWYNPNAGWPDVNTTKTRPNSGRIDDHGNIYIAGRGRRTITTTNAYMQMPKPDEGHSVWNVFARVYTRDLTGLVYSSIFQAPWDISTQQGGAHTELFGIVPVENGAMVVGGHSRDAQDGTSMIPSNVPSWASSAPAEQRWEQWEVVNGKNQLTDYRNNYDGFYGKLVFTKPASAVLNDHRAQTAFSPTVPFLVTRADGTINIRPGTGGTRIRLYDARGRGVAVSADADADEETIRLGCGSYIAVIDRGQHKSVRRFVISP